MMAREAALKHVANSKLRKPLAYNKSFECTGVRIEDTAPCFPAVNRRRAPRWRGPAKISDTDDTGATVSSQSQTFMAAHCYVRKGTEERDAEEVGWNPAPDQLRSGCEVPRGVHSDGQNDKGELSDEAGVEMDKRTGAPGDNSPGFPGVTPGPDSLSLSQQASSSPCLSV